VANVKNSDQLKKEYDELAKKMGPRGTEGASKALRLWDQYKRELKREARWK
jgi:hypothetical protein